MTARRLAATLKVALPALLAALLAAGCSDRASKPAVPAPAGVDLRPALEPFATCAELEETIEDTLVLEMKASLEQGRLGYFPVGGPVSADGNGPEAPAAGPSTFSTTNSQVEGVGEADFVQNDGTRISVLANGALHLARSWPAEALATASTTRIEGWAHDHFLARDDRNGRDLAVIFSSVYQVRPLQGAQPICPMMGAAVVGDFWCGWSHQNAVKITTLDVTDLAAPAVVSEVYLPGSYASARRIGDRVRLVMSDTLPFPAGVRWWPADLDPRASEGERAAAFQRLIAENEALIRARSLDDWLRRGTVERPGLPGVELAYACGDFAHGAAPVRPGLLTVATFDVPSASLVSRTAIFGEPGTVYASASTLWVATSHWWWWPEPGQRDATYLHAFDLTDPDRAPYLGSGVVDGIARDQYAFDEHEGALRVATTVSERVDDGTTWGRIQTAGRVSVLKRAAGGYDVVGETPPFGAGERVFGTRYFGTKGYVITAEQQDPLFVLDLSDPAAPAVLGELVMPGFLAYLHPLDATHLLGIGQQGGGATGEPRQVKVTLLDVTDPLAPLDLDTVLLGGEWAWTEAAWDPKAFTWLGTRNLLAIPMAGYDAVTGFKSDLRLFRVDAAADKAITPVGSLSMADVYQSASGADWYWAWSPYVRRSVLAADGPGPANEYVYAISDAGVRSARVSALPAWLATIRFDRDVAPLPIP